MRNRIDVVEVEHGLSWTASIMSALAILETHGGDKFDYLQDMRSQQGIGGDAMTAGFLYLAIAAGKYLDTRIGVYDCGVFSYEHLEHTEGELPWIFLEQFTPEEWISISNWEVPLERMKAIIDAWLFGPRFFQYITDGSMTLVPDVPTELKKYRVELNGRLDVRFEIFVDAANEELAGELAIQQAPTESHRWEPDSTSVGQIEADIIEEAKSA